MNEPNERISAKRFDAVSAELESISATPEDSRYIGLETACLEAIDHLLTAMFPYHIGKVRERFDEREKRTWELMMAYDALVRALLHVSDSAEAAERSAAELIDSLPEILRVLKTDITAAYQGDPAAKNLDEIILSYPAFKAISIFRLAHKLYEMNVQILPRIMTEYAHRLTGIDIHPGATIGEYFFIDHGTGVVIGETTVIGHHVKLYQHVTLGAKSFDVQEDGTLVKGIKRHPNIGNHVVIYAGATILGGDTVIGDDCVIGGGVWLTHSVEAGRTVIAKL
ncbi:MAG: hypothetical protein IJS94_06165 [Clostridia bacterium]|nr:hypothetical protein [Clostridia bacterium]